MSNIHSNSHIQSRNFCLVFSSFLVISRADWIEKLLGGSVFFNSSVDVTGCARIRSYTLKASVSSHWRNFDLLEQDEAITDTILRIAMFTLFARIIWNFLVYLAVETQQCWGCWRMLVRSFCIIVLSYAWWTFYNVCSIGTTKLRIWGWQVLKMATDDLQVICLEEFHSYCLVVVANLVGCRLVCLC